MRLNFRKIASVLASTAMLTSTIGFAAAENYPAPFSTTGGAVVYGSAAANTDVVAAFKIENSIKPSSTTTITTSGETTALFSGSSKVNVNDTISQVRAVVTSSDLPNILKKGSFSGNVDATYTQTIDLGTNPRLVFQKQPTSSDDPAYGFALSTQTVNYIYNATVTFNKAVNFTHADSKNQEITLFGQKYTVGSSTTSSELVLYKSATKLNFDSSGVLQGEVTINGKKYTVELITASTSTATIAVTSEDGTTDQKEVTEGYSKKINGITVAVITADSNNQKFTASVIAGADKLTLTNGSPVTVGDEGTQIDGTLVTFTNNAADLTKLVVTVAAPDSDNDALMPGKSFTDPVFKTFKLDFSGGLNIAEDSANREAIEIRNSGDDKMQIKFTNNRGSETTFLFAKNLTNKMELQSGDDGKNISVIEGERVYKGEYVVVGNEDQGYLLKVSTITNSSSNYADDKVKLTDVFDSSNVFDATITAEGSGTITIGGKVYSLTYQASDTSSTDNWYITMDYPDSSGTVKVVYPTMQTAKGAKVAFYEPENINFSATSGLKIPNGNGYTDVTFTYSTDTIWNVSGAGTGSINTTRSTDSVSLTVGKFTYNLTGIGTTNQSKLYLVAPDGGNVADPAVIIIEEKDDNSEYHGAVVTFEAGADSTDGIGVDDFKRTWGNDAVWDGVNLASNSNKQKDADLFGIITLIDSTDSDQKWITISYPDEQLYANLYVASAESVITGGETTGGTGVLVAVSDSEISSVSDKNLIVVGGSCVNKVAAKILQSETPLCGADFTAKTGAGVGHYIIKTVKSPYNENKIAVLVAGYEALDTKNAVDKLLEGASTDLDSSQVYPIVSA